MTSSPVLDTVIGLFSVYLALSALVTTINEHLATWLKLRATDLENGIKWLLDCKNQEEAKKEADTFFQHPLIQSLSSTRGKPSYIPAETFAQAILERCVSVESGVQRTADSVVKGIHDLPEGRLKESLKSLVTDANQDMDQIKNNIETWFNNGMDRVSGWYKRRLQLIGVVVGAFIVIALNADTLQLVQYFTTNPIVTAAYTQKVQTAATGVGATANDVSNTFIKDVQANGLPGLTLRLHGHDLGYHQLPGHIFGWMITILAISLGAPFWFDLLSTFMSVRGTGPPPKDESKSSNS